MTTEHLQDLLEELTDSQLDDLQGILTEVEWTRRIKERLTPGMKVITVCSGFSGPKGVLAVFQGFVKEGDTAPEESNYGSDYALFGYNYPGKAFWMVAPDELGKHIRIVDALPSC